MHELPYSLMSELQKYADKAHPPVHLWHPDTTKDIDLIIQRDGTWCFNGTPIKRPRLVRLFSSVLRRDGDDYFLVTPVEKCRITVEDVPFQVVLMHVQGEGVDQCLSMVTDMAESVALDDAHRMRIEQRGDEWIPYMLIRDQMEGRLSRSVYYQLADLMVEGNHEGEAWLGVWSHGHFTPMLRKD